MKNSILALLIFGLVACNQNNENTSSEVQIEKPKNTEIAPEIKINESK